MLELLAAWLGCLRQQARIGAAREAGITLEYRMLVAAIRLVPAVCSFQGGMGAVVAGGLFHHGAGLLLRRGHRHLHSS